MATAPKQLRDRVRDRRELPPPAVRRALRLTAGLTLEEIADAMGREVTPAAIGHWESGRREVGRRHLSAYAAVLRFLREEVGDFAERAEQGADGG